MFLYNLKDKPDYLKEFVLSCHDEWGTPWKAAEAKQKLNEKIELNLKRLEKELTLILLEGEELAGFVSLLEKDCEERPLLSPWYATLYVKEKYRGCNLTQILTTAILKEAKLMGFDKVYLKTELTNFYEKYGFSFLEMLANGEKIYYIDL